MKLFPALFAVYLLSGCSGTPPDYRSDGEFVAPDCPASPNCVSSTASDPDQRVAPLSPQPDAQQLQQLIKTLPRSAVVYHGPDYIHVTSTSLVFRYVDDLLFWPGEDNQMHIRSASRLGYADFGVNRKRVEHLRDEWSRMRDREETR